MKVSCTLLESLRLSNGVKEVFIIFGNNCKFYRDAKCLKKNGFCDLKCDIDGFEGGFVPLCEPLDTMEKSQDNLDLTKQSPFRPQNHVVKKRSEEC